MAGLFRERRLPAQKSEPAKAQEPTRAGQPASRQNLHREVWGLPVEHREGAVRQGGIHENLSRQQGDDRKIRT